MAQEKPNNLNLTISDQVAEGCYSNLVVITHSPNDFVLDFAQVMPGNQNAVVRRRIVMTPFHAKQFMMALGSNIQNFEKQFGTIEAPEAANSANAIPYDMIPQGKA